MTLSGTLTAAGYMWCMVEKTGTAPAKKTGRFRRLANATSNTTNATNVSKNATTPVVKPNATNATTPVVDKYADLRK